MFDFISWCFLLFKEKIPFTNADANLPLRLQLTSFFEKVEPEDKKNISEIEFSSWSILLKQYFIFLFVFKSIL